VVTILFDQREKGENKWIIQFRARKKLNGSISDPLTYANVTKMAKFNHILVISALALDS